MHPPLHPHTCSRKAPCPTSPARVHPIYRASPCNTDTSESCRGDDFKGGVDYVFEILKGFDIFAGDEEMRE
ncbi:hypothetical protein BDD12DRAFT_864775 [Trichophaea hybrida]|nr:hypothetical protein BDD12DRAFT_864775 [Trichophaea hybrida]